MTRSIKAVLFDLDGTLLDSNMESFLPVYLKALSARIAHILPPQQFVAHLMQATEAMLANDGRATNQEVFAEVFFPLVGRPRAELEPLFDAFYAEDFPKLSGITRRKPEARPVVELALALGHDTAITTNPLFPATAIRQRMAWAGVDDLPYRWVTSYENSRYCKPNLRFFDDVIARLGHRPEECLVVGDEHMDMVAAAVGCPTFLIPGPATALLPETPAPTYQGTLADLAALLEG
ncbi:MAG: 2-deoxyglucose-6-phosphatase [Chloroflexi bacterium ADurb.Bin325]|nr:MAG: 2-deoxyglucose-6-phosphatase [Chloroflexi bacterium ADurb.Bin325]